MAVGTGWAQGQWPHHYFSFCLVKGRRCKPFTDRFGVKIKNNGRSSCLFSSERLNNSQVRLNNAYKDDIDLIEDTVRDFVSIKRGCGL